MVGKQEDVDNCDTASRSSFSPTRRPQGMNAKRWKNLQKLGTNWHCVALFADKGAYVDPLTNKSEAPDESFVARRLGGMGCGRFFLSGQLTNNSRYKNFFASTEHFELYIVEVVDSMGKWHRWCQCSACETEAREYSLLVDPFNSKFAQTNFTCS